MDKMQTFSEFLATQNREIDLPTFLINLLSAIVLAHVLSVIFVRFGTTLSNRRRFSQNFVPIAATTMLIIVLVKSSLALSLGLVGALSIVRFRAAIKDPEELSYLFLCIALGLGFGANQAVITSIAFVVIVAILAARRLERQHSRPTTMTLMVRREGEDLPELERLTGVLSEKCSSLVLRRFDRRPGFIEGVFGIEFPDFDRLDQAQQALLELDGELDITLIRDGDAGAS